MVEIEHEAMRIGRLLGDRCGRLGRKRLRVPLCRCGGFAYLLGHFGDGRWRRGVLSLAAGQGWSKTDDGGNAGTQRKPPHAGGLAGHTAEFTSKCGNHSHKRELRSSSFGGETRMLAAPMQKGLVSVPKQLSSYLCRRWFSTENVRAAGQQRPTANPPHNLSAAAKTGQNPPFCQIGLPPPQRRWSDEQSRPTSLFLRRLANPNHVPTLARRRASSGRKRKPPSIVGYGDFHFRQGS